MDDLEDPENSDEETTKEDTEALLVGPSLLFFFVIFLDLSPCTGYDYYFQNAVATRSRRHQGSPSASDLSLRMVFLDLWSAFQDTFGTLERIDETQSTEVKINALVVRPLSTFPPHIFIGLLISNRTGFVTYNWRGMADSPSPNLRRKSRRSTRIREFYDLTWHTHSEACYRVHM